MSPTEDDLRTALRDGAGDTPDADHIMFVAERRRADRQKRLLSVAAAVIVVGGVATGGTYLVRNSGNDDTTAGGAGAASAQAPAAGTNTRAGENVTSGTGCPAQVSAPSGLSRSSGGKAADRIDANGPLFAEPVASALVCAYPSTTTPGPANAPARPSSVTLTGTDATTLTDSLENATKVHPGVCEDVRTTAQRTIVVLARTADGTQLPAVTTTINEVSCAVVVSNGSAVRYAWTPPAPLHHDFVRLGGSGVVNGNAHHTEAPVGSGAMSGSPLH